MQKKLSKEQQQEYGKAIGLRLNQTQQDTANLCLQYYLVYKEAGNITSDKIALAFRCAYYMAQKSQYSVTVKGQKLRGISFSLNNLLKEHKLDDTMFMLKDMTRKIKFMDEDTCTYLNNVVKQISFLITLHSKFEKTFSQKLELKDRFHDAGSYSKIFTSFAWLLFIIVKNEVLKRSLQLLPNTCMVAHIISTMLILSWQYIKPEALMRDRKLNDNCSEKEMKRVIKEKVLQIFCIKDLTEYSRVAESFEKYFNQIIQKWQFKMSDDKYDFLSPENITTNYKKLDKYYEKNLNIQNLDERIFFKERALNLTPSKFTPFARQGYVNKFQKTTLGNKLGGIQKMTKQQTFNSHRILNYEAVEKQIENKTQPILDIKLPKNIIQSPSMVKVPFIMATPISTGMEMYNFINQKKKKINSISLNHIRQFDREAITIVERILNFQNGQIHDKASNTTKQQMIVALYRIFSEDYLSANLHERDTPALMKAFLGVSIELVFFVSNMTLTFAEIEEELKFQPFEMWKAISYFLNSDKSIPHPIKIHFLDLEVNFISYKIWQNYDMVMKLSNFGSKSAKEMTQVEVNSTQRLFKRTVHQIAFQITRLANSLELDEVISQKIFDLMKEIVINHSELLYRRHLDQLIICSIFAVCKMGGYKMMFNTIMECYTNSNPNLKDIIDEIVFHVYISQQEQPNGIIAFYNSVFIRSEELKEFIRLNGANTGTINSNNKNAKKNTLLMSPLKAIIPKQINCKSKNFAPTNNPALKSKNGMTPQTQLLYAYSQSPILKYEVNTFNKPIKSKKVLNYLEEEQLCRKQSQEQLGMGTIKPTTSDNNIGMGGQGIASNYQSTTCEFINKKFVKKSTTPTSSQQPRLSEYSTQGMHQMNQQMHLPLQNLTKQNLNPPLSSNSHRTFYQMEKKQYNSRQTAISQQMEETKYRNKNNYPYYR